MKTNLMLTIMLLAFALVCQAQEQQESKNIAKEIERFLGSKKRHRKGGVIGGRNIIRRPAQPCWNGGIWYKRTHGTEYR